MPKDTLKMKSILSIIHDSLTIKCCHVFKETEEFLSSLVVNGTVSAQIDRLAGIIEFRKHKDPNEILNDWSNNINQLMKLVNKSTHLITKEEMLHKVR